MLSIASKATVERLLLQYGLVDQAKIDALKQQATKENKPFLALLVEQKTVAEEDLTKLMGSAAKQPYVNLINVTVKPEILTLLPQELAKNYMAVPFGLTNGHLAVAMLDPTNVQAVDFIARKTGKPVSAFLASRTSIENILTQYASVVGVDLSAELSAGQEAQKPKTAKEAKQTAQSVKTLVQDAPITRALNAIMEYAAQSKASDIHIEPREKELKIRFRVDGILQDTMTLPKSIEPALISRIKILSNLKIDEHRIPQDGQAQFKTSNREIDLRIAVSPVVHGEQVVVRLLDKANKILTLDGLGFKGQAFEAIRAGIKKPHGMTLSTGPTGSGKSTTLYAIIQEIKDVAINIVTLEDPVEYKMEGINQIQVNPRVGLTFASGLRSILRQDPNVIMVGEIRDKETADLAVQSALTGHVVLSTLHTNSAAGVLPRLLDMKIEPFLIASTVNTVIGQRLVRMLCETCRKQEPATEAEVRSIEQVIGGILPKTSGDIAAKRQQLGYEALPLGGQNAYTLFRAVGCSACSKGYRGRIGIYEVFSMNDAMEQLLVRHATTSEVQKQAEADGMVTMKQDGYLKALAGITTIEEVARVAADF